MQKVILDVSASSVYALLTMKALPNGGVIVLFVLKDLLDEIKLPTASSSNSTTSFGFGYDGFLGCPVRAPQNWLLSHSYVVF